MLPFSFTYTKAFNGSITETDKARVLNQLAKYAEKNNGQNIAIAGNVLSFKVSLLSLWSLNKFTQIEKGVFILNDTTITFRFYMYRLLLIATLLSVFTAIQTHEAWLGIFAFVVVGLGNWLLSIIRYKRMLSDIAAGINRLLERKDSANRVLMQQGQQ